MYGISSDVKELRKDVKSFNNRLQKIEGKLANLDIIVGNLEPEVKDLKQQTATLEERVDNSVGKLQSLDDEVFDLHEETGELEELVERLDNLQRNHNLKIRGLKEGHEGKDLGFLIELFTGWAGSDCDIEIRLLAAYRIGKFRKEAKFPRDVIVNAPNWNIKSKILESYWEQPDILIDGKRIYVFPDLSNIILRKRRKF